METTTVNEMVDDWNYKTYLALKLVELTFITFTALPTHLGTQKSEDLIRHSHLKIFHLQHKIKQIAEKCLPFQLTNADNQHKNPRNRGSKPGSHGRQTSLRKNLANMVTKIF